MILVNSGAFLSISSWFCELTELIFVVIPQISSTGYLPPPKTQGIMGHVQVANIEFFVQTQSLFTRFLGREDWTLGWIKVPLTPNFFFLFSKRIQNLVKIKKRIE